MSNDILEIYFNSRTATEYYNGLISDAMYSLPVIEITKSEKAYICAKNAVIPNSFYNINNTNNKLNFSLNNLNYSITFTNGNYNITTFRTHLYDLLFGLDYGQNNANYKQWTITYNNKLNKLVYSHQYYNFTFLKSSSCFELMGFKEFRRKCESKKKLFDCAGEEERWGCNHLQVASCLSSAIGLNFTTRLALGLEGHAVTLAPHLCNIVDSCAPSLGALRALISGVESLHEAGTLSLRSKCVEIDGLVHEIELQSRSIRQSDGGLLWIHKTRDDLPAEAAEELKVPLPDKKEEEVEASE